MAAYMISNGIPTCLKLTLLSILITSSSALGTHSMDQDGNVWSVCQYKGLDQCQCSFDSNQNLIRILCDHAGLTSTSVLRENLQHEKTSEFLKEMIITGNNIPDLQANFLVNCSGKTGKPLYRSYLQLLKLDLSNNNIHTLHGKSLHCIQNLQQLNLNDNNLDRGVIQHNARFLSDLEELKILRMQNVFNFMKDGKLKEGISMSSLFENSRSGLKALEEIHLEKNFFGIINKNIFAKLPSLKRLYLSHNLIQNPVISSEWKDEYGTAKECPLEELYLSNNSISTLSEEFMKEINRMKNLKALDISGNPFFCDCRLLPFRQWMDNLTQPLLVRNRKHLKCVGPPGMENTYVVDVPLEDMENCYVKAAGGEKATHHARVAIGVMLTMVAVALIAVAFVKRDMIRKRGATMASSWIPRMFSRSRGYRTVDEPATVAAAV